MKDIAIAVDLGGTQLRAALVDAAGNILERDSVLTEAEAGPEKVVQQIGELVSKVKTKAAGFEILGVGVSSPGPLDTDKGLALSLPTLKGFTEFPLRDALKKTLQMDVKLENDGIAAAIGEWRFGAGQGLANLVYVTVSTGVGGGVIVDNHVMRGRKGMGGHVGHMAIEPDGLMCNCGNKGCIEAYAAGPAFTARARKRMANPAITTQQVFAAAKSGDAVAKELVAHEAMLLGLCFTSLLHLFSPEILVMGGGLSNEFEALYPAIRAYMDANAMAAFKDVPLVKAKLGDNSGLIGAASLVFD
ncbi:MAG: ROK family protein [Aestuariivirga sp.]